MRIVSNKSVKNSRIIAVLFCCIFLSGCSIQKIAIKSTSGLLVNGLAAINEESDLILAEQAIASNLKLLEALIKSDPGNSKLSLMAAEGYTGYALGFVEDESPARASVFYLRAKDYATSVVEKNKTFAGVFNQGIGQIQEALKTAKKSDVPCLFWLANSWGSYINLNKTDVNSLANLPKIEIIMQRVFELDETFYFGGPHLFLGSILASKPAIFGGNPEKAKEHFEACLRINDNKFLMAKYLYAKTYAVQAQDRELFKKLLSEVLDASKDLLPEQRLANEIARKKAKALLALEEDLFL
jgi:tetratricopeptide (TPR) repeat protein